MTLIPAATLAGIDRHVRLGCQPGSFVEAVLENNLAQAFRRADAMNRDALGAIVDYVMAEVPGCAWGSRDACLEWREAVRALWAVVEGPSCATEVLREMERLRAARREQRSEEAED